MRHIEGFAENQHAEQYTENRNQINIAGGLAGRDAADAVVVATVGAEGDKGPEIDNGQERLVVPICWETDLWKE